MDGGESSPLQQNDNCQMWWGSGWGLENYYMLRKYNTKISSSKNRSIDAKCRGRNKEQDICMVLKCLFKDCSLVMRWKPVNKQWRIWTAPCQVIKINITNKVRWILCVSRFDTWRWARVHSRKYSGWKCLPESFQTDSKWETLH